MDSMRLAILTLLRSLHSFEPSERENTISVLQSLERTSSIQTLLMLLQDADPEVRCDAAEALLRIDSQTTLEAVMTLLSDTDDGVRWHACGLLYDFGDERATPDLISILLNDPEPDVRLFAAQALGRIGNLTAIEALRQALEFDTGEDHEGRRVSNGANEAIDAIQQRHQHPTY